jgi:hypothetical protein
MRTFEPKSIARSRGQILYRYRQGQTYDHGNIIAQVVGYANDDALQEPKVDDRQLVEEAMRFVRYWRTVGANAPDTTPGSDRAPEFPPDDPLASTHYEVVVPGKVFSRIWPLVMRCANAPCGLVFETSEPRVGEAWPPACPRCRQSDGNHQLQFVFVHECGEIAPCLPPRQCPGGAHTGFRLNDRPSRFQDFRWECLTCSRPVEMQLFCSNPGCNWTRKRMAPQVHTASAAFAGHGVPIVNVRTPEHSERRDRPEFVIASLGRWLGECSHEEADRVITAQSSAPDPVVLRSIEAMEAAGLREQAAALRAKFVPLGFDDLRNRVAGRLGFDPLKDGLGLARAIETYEQVLQLPSICLPELVVHGPEKRRETYARYPDVLRGAGFDPERTMLVTEFPVTYLAVGYSRGGFEPRDADLVAYRGRAGRGEAIKTLLYANPTHTEALVFGLDRDRVARWLVANCAASARDLAHGNEVVPWFAAQVPDFDGRMPPPWSPEPIDDRSRPGYGAGLYFRLLHSVAHQVLRAVAVDSGFAETGLSEYLFPMSLAFAIYPNGGSEFTIGGLRTVLEQNLDDIVHRAVENDTCLYDPNCLLANRGVDHGCLQLPETACQCWNWFLSRWELFGEPSASPDRIVGYWEPMFDTTASVLEKPPTQARGTPVGVLR